MIARDRYLTIRASAEELAMLKALAAKDGITGSDWLRLVIRRSHEQAFGSARPKRPKPKR